MSGKTIDQHLEAVRAFLNWCVDRDRLGANPLAKVKKIDAHKPVRPRRSLLVEEARRLLSKSPSDRRRVYLMAMVTGLRPSELAALHWGDVRLNAPAPFIKLRAEETKARRADSIALTEELITELRSIRPESAADTDTVFASIPSIEEFRQDLEVAGIAKDVAGRGRIDFHSLRHTASTLLAEQNVPQRLAIAAHAIDGRPTVGSRLHRPHRPEHGWGLWTSCRRYTRRRSRC